MKMKTLLSLIAAGMVLVPSVASAGDVPVNCRTEQTGLVNIYEGWASCSAITSEGWTTISRWVPASPSPTVILSEYVNGAWAQCSANVPFLTQQPLYQEVCDYTPSAYLTIDNYSAGEVYVAARGADRDGTFTVQLYVDGVLQSGTSTVLDVFTGGYTIGQRVRVESVVTDNDGYTTRKSGWAVLEDTGEISPFPL